MEEVGNILKHDGYEFIAVNSMLRKNPQFVCLKNKTTFFVVVKGCLYPENPNIYNKNLIKKIKNQSSSINAKLIFAGVGFANANDYNRTLSKKDSYVINFEGLQFIT